MGLAFRIIFALLFLGIAAFTALKVQGLFGVADGKAPSHRRKKHRVEKSVLPLKYISMDEDSSKVKIDRLSDTSKPVKAAPGTAVLIEKDSGKRFTLTTED